MKNSFERIEKKYLVNQEQKDKLVNLLLEHAEYDKFCIGNKTYKIMNVFYDTPNQDLISYSIDSPNHIYKEKLRARKYVDSDTCFLEIKKKYDGVVGKRRIKLHVDELNAFIHEGIAPEKHKYVNKQIVEEIKYFLKQYPDIKENLFLSYDRLGFFDKLDPNLRITFDNNIRYSRTSFDWENVKDTINVLEEGTYVLEIKTSNPLPLWLARFLSEEGIHHKRFSKYGTGYKYYLKEDDNNGLIQKLYL